MTNHTFSSLFSIVIMSSASFAAEVVQLNNDNTFSGSITNSETPSIVHLKHPFAESAMKIKESSIKQIKFQNNNQASSHSEKIQLINGDHFPCDITNINEDKISFNSSELGKHIISRDQVKKITFNTKSKKILYRGPGDDLSAWSTTTEGWSIEKGTISVAKRSQASIQIPKLTKNYVLKFTSKRDRRSPRFRFCFSGNNKQADKKSDYYYIDFNSQGINLQRSNNGQTNSLAEVPANDVSFNKPEIQVTIYVDRKNQKLALYINDKLIKTIMDAEHDSAPEGNFLVIKNLQRLGYHTQISDISVSSWDGSVNEASEKSTESLKKHDLITDLNGNIITGSIHSLTVGNSSTLSFTAPFAKNDSTMPQSSIDVLQFRHSDKELELSDTHFILKLSNGGQLNYPSSQFVNSKLEFEHPILGSVSIPNKSISSLNSTPKKAELKDKE